MKTMELYYASFRKLLSSSRWASQNFTDSMLPIRAPMAPPDRCRFDSVALQTSGDLHSVPFGSLLPQLALQSFGSLVLQLAFRIRLIVLALGCTRGEMLWSLGKAPRSPWPNTWTLVSSA